MIPYGVEVMVKRLIMSVLAVLLFSLTPTLFSQGHSIKDNDSRVKAALEVLEKEFQGIKSISGEFIQTKHMSLFKHSIILKGNLLIKFPHYFRWEVDEPVKTTITAEGDSIAVWDEESGETTHTSTKNNPVVQHIWSQIDSWFMGRYALLSKDYSISVVDDEKSDSAIPVLAFTPKSKPLSLAIKSVTLYFAKGTPESSGREYLQKVVIEEKSGDTTIMEFSNLRIVLEGGS